MVEVIFCLVALCFLGWVLMLRSELAELKAQNKKLRSEVERFVKDTTKDIELLKTSHSWGKGAKENDKSQPRSEWPA